MDGPVRASAASAPGFRGFAGSDSGGVAGGRARQGLDGQVALADPEVDVPTKSALDDDLVTRPEHLGPPAPGSASTGSLKRIVKSRATFRLGEEGPEVDAGRQGPVCVERILGLDREAFVPERKPSVLGQEAVRRVEGGDPSRGWIRRCQEKGWRRGG